MTKTFTFDIYDKKDTTFSKPTYLETSYGMHTVRILTNPMKVFTHFFMGKGSFRCLGKECPVCKVNTSLKLEYPDDYRKQPGYNASMPRHLVNILDRTFVKICPECEYEVKKDLMQQFPNACPKCQTMLVNVEPVRSNKVKLVNFSDTNARDLVVFQASELDENDEPLGLGNFDIDIVVNRGASGRKEISVKPSTSKTSKEPVSVPEEMLYDLSTATITLTPDEIVQFIKGVSLRDIFVARNSSKESAKIGASEVAPDLEKSIEDRLAELGF